MQGRFVPWKFYSHGHQYLSHQVHRYGTEEESHFGNKLYPRELAIVFIMNLSTYDMLKDILHRDYPG